MVLTLKRQLQVIYFNCKRKIQNIFTLGKFYGKFFSAKDFAYLFCEFSVAIETKTQSFLENKLTAITFAMK